MSLQNSAGQHDSRPMLAVFEITRYILPNNIRGNFHIQVRNDSNRTTFIRFDFSKMCLIWVTGETKPVNFLVLGDPRWRTERGSVDGIDVEITDYVKVINAD